MTALLAMALLVAADAGADASASVEVISDSSCPSADAVRAALNALEIPAPARRAKVTVRDTADGFRLEFAWDGREPTDTRALAASRDCQARAQTAAVVLATWLVALPSTPEPAPAAIAIPDPAVTAAATVEVAPTPTRADARVWWLGAGLGASAGGGVVPSARVEMARVRPEGQGLGWIASLHAALPRSQVIGGGTSRWVRPAVGVAGTAGWRLGRVGVAADLGPLASVTVAWGADYPNNRSDQTLVLGLGAGLRLLPGPGPSRPWIELRVIDWFGTQRLRFDSTAGGGTITAALPALEGFVTLGWNLPL